MLRDFEVGDVVKFRKQSGNFGWGFVTEVMKNPPRVRGLDHLRVQVFKKDGGCQEKIVTFYGTVRVLCRGTER